MRLLILGRRRGVLGRRREGDFTSRLALCIRGKPFIPACGRRWVSLGGRGYLLAGRSRSLHPGSTSALPPACGALARVLCGLLTLVMPAVGIPASADVLPEELKAAFSIGYDSNILDASDAEVDAFRKDAPGSFFVVEDMRDEAMRFALEACWPLERVWRLRPKLLVGYERAQYLHNSVRTEDTYLLELRTRPSRSTRVALELLYRPQIYGRHRIDKDALPGQPQFRAEVHRRLGIGLGLRQALGDRLRAKAKLERTWRDYSRPFDERDRNRVEVETGLSWTFRRWLDLGLEGGFRRSVSKNEPYVGSDLSYRQWSLEPSLRFLATEHVYELALSADIARRRYTSEDPKDESHYGREDLIGALRVTLVRKLSPAISATVDYCRNWRWAGIDSGASDGFDEEGTFSEHTVYSTLLWRWEL